MTPESKTDPDKPKLNKDSLVSCGIFYDAQVYKRPEDLSPEKFLPDHVENIRKILLNFTATVHPDWKEGKSFTPEGALKPVESAWLDTTGVDAVVQAEKNKESAAWTITPASIRISRELRDLANNAEDAWTHIMMEKIFRPFRRTEMETENDQMQEWRLAQNLPWNEFERWKNVNPQRHGLTGPKPDITYGYPIYRPGENLPNVLKLHNWARHFSYTSLRTLREKPGINLRSSPNTKLTTAKGQKDLKEENLLCFPWAIVELKHATVTRAEVEFCYCQAANASAVALEMRQSLYREAHAKSLQLEIPPIISFTCIGPKLKLWLTYFKQTGEVELKMMKCIYATDLRSPWGVLSACVIVKNMQGWAVVTERATTGLLLTLLNYGRHRTTQAESEQESHSDTKSSRSNVDYTPFRQPTLDVISDYDIEPVSPVKTSGDLLHWPRTSSPGPELQTQRPPAIRSRKSEPTRPVRHHDQDPSAADQETIESDDSLGDGYLHRTIQRTPSPIKAVDEDVERNDSPMSQPRQTSEAQKVQFRKNATNRRYTQLAHRVRDYDNASESAQSSNNDDDGDDELELYGSDSYAEDSDERDAEDSTASSNAGDDPELDTDEVSDVATDASVEDTLCLPMRAFTTDDVAEIKQQALEALDGATFITLPTFEDVVDRSADVQILFAIETCLFADGSRYELREEWTSLHLSQDASSNMKFRSMVRVLRSRAQGRYRVSLHGPSSAINEALWRLYDDGETAQLREMFISLLSCYQGEHIISVLTAERLVKNSKEWLQMEEEAFNVVQGMNSTQHRRVTQSMREKTSTKHSAKSK